MTQIPCLWAPGGKMSNFIMRKEGSQQREGNGDTPTLYEDDKPINVADDGQGVDPRISIGNVKGYSGGHLSFTCLSTFSTKGMIRGDGKPSNITTNDDPTG